jgi:hypothetical protein
MRWLTIILLLAGLIVLDVARFSGEHLASLARLIRTVTG